MDRAGKAQAIDTLKGVFDNAGAVVVTHYMGLTVKELEDLRGRLRAEGAKLQVVKNTLAQKALEGRAGEGADALFTGPVAIAYAPDPVSAAKITTDYAKGNDKFTVVGGVMGATVLDTAGISALATLPSLDQLRAQLVGLIAAPATRLATIISAPGAGPARAVTAYATKEAADAPAEAA